VASFATLAHGFGLQVTAEGVETDAQHTIVETLGCGFAQGHLYARPMGARAIQRLVANCAQIPVP